MVVLALLLLWFVNLSLVQSCTVQTKPCANSTSCENQHFIIEGANNTLLCNNTYVHETCLGNQKGIDCIVEEELEWLLPDERVVQTGDGTAGVGFKNGDEIVRTAQTLQIEGVYTCNRNGSKIHIGLYFDINRVLQVDIATNISSLFEQSGPIVTLNCTIRQFPPTCLHWHHNGVEIMNQTATLKNATETVYVSSYSPQESPEGNYTCSVQSVGTEIKHNSSSVIFERLSFKNANLMSASVLQVQWTQSLETHSCEVYYKQTDQGNETSFHTTTDPMQANISNLTVNATYYINVLCRSSGSVLFFPSPIEVILSSPGALRNVTTNKSDKAYTVSWLPPAYPAGIYDKVHLSYYAACNGKTHNVTVEVNSQQIALGEMKPGLNYTAVMFASNVLGFGVQTVLSNLALPGQAPQTPQNLNVTAINSSTLLATWQLVTCFNSSGDLPQYILSIRELNSQDTKTVTKPWYIGEHYFVDLSEGKEYKVTIRAVNRYNQSDESTEIERTLEEPINNNDTDGTPPPNGTIPTAEDTLPIIVGGSVGGAVLALVCIGIIVIIVIVASCRRKPNATQDCAEMPNLMHNFEPRSEVPYFKEFPEDTKASEGETVFFTVQVAGYPEPTLVWTYMGEPLSRGGNIEIFSDGTLIIKDIGTDNSGVYQFTAKNMMGEISNQVQLDVEEEEEEEHFKRSMFGSTSSVLHHLIPLQALDKYVEAHHANENEGFNLQYSYLKTTSKHDTRVCLAHKPLNRYRNIIPYDNNRVILRKEPGWENSYINASYIDGYGTSQASKFIATQGPLLTTIIDFWHMIWQENVHVVVMLVNRVEGNKVKCEEYWPTSIGDSQCYGPCTVRLLNEEPYANFVIREMELLVENSESPHNIKQFHFTAWPDHGVPEHGSPLLMFYKKIMDHHQMVGKGPILVHCSAGVGRTGTLIAVDIALEQINSENGVDITAIINKMRGQRMKMVQTAAQFIFLHDTVLEHALCGTTVIPVQELGRAIQDLDTIDHETNKTMFYKQYQVIQKVTPKGIEYKHNASQGNGECIRKGLLPPSDQRRVILRGKTPQYINATFVDGYQQKKGYIITQNPMESTVPDFWKMVVQHGCSSIVMLAGTNEVGFDKDSICHQYWPLEIQQSEVYNHISVKLSSEDVYDNIVTRNFDVKDMNSGKILLVTQLQITNWLPDGQCPNHRTIIRLLEEILIAQRRSGNNPIVIHCSDTITRSGILCATSITVEQLKVEATVDIFQVVKTLRIQRPGSVPSVNHYKMIFDLSYNALSMFETYNNF